MVKVRKMKFEDVLKMRDFAKHDDIRLLHYNFEYETIKDCKLWYKAKTKLFRRYAFSIYDNNVFVGYITLKNINWFTKKAEMGIVMNPAHISKGIGTQAIKLYLEIVFNKYKMKSIYLKVADFNIRARKCYLKAGFKGVNEEYEEYEEQEYLINDSKYLNFDDMIYKNGIIYTKYHKMRINTNYQLEKEKNVR